MEPTLPFDKAMKFIALWEWGNRADGGYTNDPTDPGGETKWGISKKAHPDLNIKELTLEEAKEIYKEHYWNPARCDSMPMDRACVVFDSAVNCGLARAVMWSHQQETAEQILQERQLYYNNLVKAKPALKKYINGWSHRVEGLRNFIKNV